MRWGGAFPSRDSGGGLKTHFSVGGPTRSLGPHPSLTSPQSWCEQLDPSSRRASDRGSTTRTPQPRARCVGHGLSLEFESTAFGWLSDRSNLACDWRTPALSGAVKRSPTLPRARGAPKTGTGTSERTSKSTTSSTRNLSPDRSTTRLAGSSYRWPRGWSRCSTGCGLALVTPTSGRAVPIGWRGRFASPCARRVARDYLAPPGHFLLCRDRLTVRPGLLVFPR